MKIKNLAGRAWISKYDNSGITIHLVNAEVEEAELKGTQLIIRVVPKPRIARDLDD